MLRLHDKKLLNACTSIHYGFYGMSWLAKCINTFIIYYRQKHHDIFCRTKPLTRRHNAIHTMAIIYQKVVASSTQIVFNFVINDNTNKFAYNLDVFFLDIRILNVLNMVTSS